MAKEPAKWPSLRRGEGSWSWSPERLDSKRRPGVVELRHRIDKHPYIERADTPAQCLDAREDRRRAVAAAALAPVVDERKTVADLVAEWYAFAANGKAPQTIRTYDRSRDLVVAALGTQSAASITVDDLESFLQSLVTERNFGKSGVRKRRTHLHMIFAYAARRHIVAENLMPKVETPGVNVEERPHRWFDSEEFDRVRTYLCRQPSTMNLVYLLMLLTGLRPGEALGVCWDAIDFDKGTLKVRTAMQRTARRQRFVDKLKTKQSNRTVELPPDLLRLLRREHRDQLAARLRADHWAQDDNLAFTKHDGTHIRFDQLDHQCAQLCRVVGVKRITPNGFRHSNASMLLARGASPADVARHLGHKDMTQVMKTYGHEMHETIPTARLLGGGL